MNRFGWNVCTLAVIAAAASALGSPWWTAPAAAVDVALLTSPERGETQSSRRALLSVPSETEIRGDRRPVLTRIEVQADGRATFEGRAAPGARVAVRGVLEQWAVGIAASDGRFRVVSVRRFPAGDHRLTLHVISPAGASVSASDPLRLALPNDFTGALHVAPEPASAQETADRPAPSHRSDTRIRLAQATKPGVSSPPTEGTQPDPGVLAPVFEWIERAGRDYQSEVVRRLATEPPAPAPSQAPPSTAPASAKSAGQQAKTQPSTPPSSRVTASTPPVRTVEAAPPAETGVLGSLEGWLRRSSREYQDTVVRGLTYQASPSGLAQPAPQPPVVAPVAPTPPASTMSDAARADAERRAAEARRRAEAERIAAEQAAARKAADDAAALARQKAEERIAADQRRAQEAAEQRAAEARRLQAEADQRAAAEREAAEQRLASERAAEQARKAREAADRLAQDTRRAEEAARQSELKRLADQRAADEARRASERAAEERRLAEQRRAAEQQAADIRRMADDAARNAENARREAEFRRQAELRAADEARRKAEADRAAEAARIAAEARAEANRQLAEQRQAREMANAEAARRRAEDAARLSAADRAPVTAKPAAPSAAPASTPTATRVAEAARRALPGRMGAGASSARPEAGGAVVEEGSATRAAPGDISSASRRDRACRERAGEEVDPPATYIVKRGDTLWEISAVHYAKGMRFKRIHKANLRKVPNPHRIYPCQRLLIPAKPKRTR